MKQIAWLLLLCPALSGAVEFSKVPGVDALPQVRLAPQAALPALPAQLPAAPSVQAPLAPQVPAAQAALERAAMPPQSQNAAPQAQFNAGRQAFDGFGSVDNPDTQYSWYDAHTGQYETQASKIKKALDLALSHRLGAAIKNGLKYNTLYRVDNDARFDDYTVRTTGDDPEQAASEPLVIFKHSALRQLSPEYLAAKLASMWARHLYRETMPVSAEKTYVEGSVMVRVFMGLTQSNSGWWNGDKDRVVSVPGHYDNSGTWVTQNFETFLHQYFWRQGFNYQDVRQGPYFKDKIMGAQGQPDIDADARARRTLFQRAQSGEISQDEAAAAQQRFQGFVSNER